MIYVVKVFWAYCLDDKHDGAPVSIGVSITGDGSLRFRVYLNEKFIPSEFFLIFSFSIVLRGGGGGRRGNDIPLIVSTKMRNRIRWTFNSSPCFFFWGEEGNGNKGFRAPRGCRGVQLGQPCVQPSKTIEKYRHRKKKKKKKFNFLFRIGNIRRYECVTR